jgi:rhodanese-related sulfurtransferase
MIRFIPLSLLFAALAFGTSCESQTSAGSAKSSGGDVDVATFARYIKEMPNAQILDVRTPGETAQGIIAGAAEININDADFKNKVSRLDKDKPVLVYCRSGARSGNAMRQMTAMGFKQVYNLSGGIMSWQSARQPLTRK